MQCGPRAIVATKDLSLAGALARELSAANVVPFLAFTWGQLMDVAHRNPDVRAVLLDPHLLGEDPSGLAHLQAAITGRVDLVGGVQGVQEAVEPGPLAWNRLRLDTRRHLAWIDHEPLTLTPIEFRILEVLLSACGAAVPSRELEDRVRGAPPMDGGKRLSTHIRRIRTKIGDRPRASVLLTVRGIGYRLADGPRVEDESRPRRRTTRYPVGGTSPAPPAAGR